MKIDYQITMLIFYRLIIIFVECDFVQGMIFRGRRSKIIHNFTMDVELGYKDIEKIKGGIQGCMMETKGIISIIRFKLKIEKENLVSFNGQSITFRLSIKEF